MENKKNQSRIQLAGPPVERILQLVDLLKDKRVDLDCLNEFLSTANSFALDILGWPKDEHDTLCQQNKADVEMCENLYADVKNKIATGENREDVRRFLLRKLIAIFEKEYDHIKHGARNGDNLYSTRELWASLVLFVGALHVLFMADEQPFQSVRWLRIRGGVVPNPVDPLAPFSA